MTETDPNTMAHESESSQGAFHRTAGESLLYVPGKLAFAIMAVVAIPVYTHFFTKEDIGRFDLALRFALFVWTLSVLWLNNALLRFYPTYAQRNEEASFLGVVTLLKWVGLVVGVGLCFAARKFLPDRLVGSYRDFLGLAALVFVGRSSLELGLTLLAAKRKPGTYSVVSTVDAVAKLAVGVLIAVGFKVGVAGLLWGAAIVPFAVYFGGIHRQFGPSQLAFGPSERRMLRELIAYGTPICLSLVFSFFLANIDRYILKYLTDDGQVGIYSIGYFLADQPVQFIYSTLMLAAFPAVMHLFEASGSAAAEKLVRSLIRLYLLVGVPTCVLLGVLARPILYAIAFGEPRASYVVVPWLAAAALVLGLMQYYSMGLYIGKRTFLLLGATISATALNVLLNALLIPRHGYYACGIARILSNAALLLLVAAAARSHLRIRFPVVSFLRILGASAAVGAVLYLAQTWLPASPVAVAALFCAGFGLYAILAVAVGEVSREEVRRFLTHVLSWRSGN